MLLGVATQPPVIGLTGGIASGKSAVLQEFERCGVITLDADLVARELVEPGKPALADIVERFGHRMLEPSGELDRRQLRDHVFADTSERLALEAILHPAIRSTLRERSFAANTPYVVIGIPLLVESGGYEWLNRVLLVDVADALQLRRVVHRDGVNLDQAKAALASQTSRASRLAVADDVIVNDGPISALEPMVKRLDRMYRELTRKTKQEQS